MPAFRFSDTTPAAPAGYELAIPQVQASAGPGDPTRFTFAVPANGKLKQHTVAGLPSGAEGDVAFATNGRKVGEGAASGTGVPVYFSNGSWRVYSTDLAVAA